MSSPAPEQSESAQPYPSLSHTIYFDSIRVSTYITYMLLSTVMPTQPTANPSLDLYVCCHPHHADRLCTAHSRISVHHPEPKTPLGQRVLRQRNTPKKDGEEEAEKKKKTSPIKHATCQGLPHSCKRGYVCVQLKKERSEKNKTSVMQVRARIAVGLGPRKLQPASQ